jgi:hypothetical protein
MSYKKHTPLFILITCLSVSLSIYWFMNSFLITKAEDRVNPIHTEKTVTETGKRVVVDLSEKKVTLFAEDGSTTVLPIVSQGKPGSYYETIGGVYTNDYKIPLHFSSIGHVFMPYSVHIFGQYFIHGIPYYPSGEDVTSEFSGGCVRLANNDAKTVFDFVETGTKIILTQDKENSFDSTPRAEPTIESQKMTTLMVAIVSLETLTQDDHRLNTDGRILTRKESLNDLVTSGSTSTINLHVSTTEKDYILLMNKKASAIGLSSTNFKSMSEPALTTYDDYLRFMSYVSSYKSYLLSLPGLKI